MRQGIPRGASVSETRLETATLGGGCFWCLEAVYELLEGVESVVPGYAGGHMIDPTYEAVCSGTTGHAEVVQVRFDPERLSFREVLEVFFILHDATTPNRQGADVGPQYRSAVFYHTEEQRAAAAQLISELEAEGGSAEPIVTEVTALERFWPAESYHRAYYRRNGRQPYCRAVVGPKVALFRFRYGDRLRTPEPVGS
ncbi:MAG: peptide-methionine (S)-S-oxide reductase MsrA [Gemmatimonadota bacterium]